MNPSLVFSAWPNPHPPLVHLPIALLLASVVLDAACLMFRRHTWLDRAATTLIMAGAASLLAAYVSGEQAAEAAAPVAGIALGVLADHDDLALLSLCAWGVAAPLRLVVTWLGRHDRRIHLGIYRLLALIVSLAAAGLLVLTAAHGAALVYQQGVGVSFESFP